MTVLRILGAGALVGLLLVSNAMARGGSVMRGAMVGGLVGGSGGAATGAKVGAVAGATSRVVDRTAVNAESQSRAQYQASPAYQNAQHSNFNQAPPEVLVTNPSTRTAASSAGEAVIRIGGKPIVGITYPADWKQKAGEENISAVSADGQAWSVLAVLKGVQGKPAGIERVKEGLGKYLQDIKYESPKETERGALVISGTGKTKKNGIEVAFVAGVFESGAGLAGAAFIVDDDVEDHYKETVRHICQTIRGAKDIPN
jgi:hypothetical protein